MSPLPVRMTPKKAVVLNSVAEFLGIWALRGECSLSLETKDRVTTIAFSHSLSVIQRIPFTLPLLRPSVAAATVGRLGESGIGSGLPAIRLPSWARPVLHQPPHPWVQLLNVTSVIRRSKRNPD